MATTFSYDGANITNDFRWTDPDTGEQFLVPFGNLLIWDKKTLDHYGITKTVTPDVPPVISDRQFFQNLAVHGLITQEEALAAVQVGALPSGLEYLVSQMPQDTQFAARMLLSGATQFERYHPLVASFASAYGWTQQELDGFWIEASAL